MLLLQCSRGTSSGVLFLALLFLVLIDSSSPSSKKGHRKEIREKRDGSWSAWSAWSLCSRTCGGGIRSQTRQCQTRRSRPKAKDSKEYIDPNKLWKNVTAHHCEGHATRHHICNTHVCPKGTIGIRESQCKTFDNRPFMGKVYQWEAFLDEKSPCSLTCRAKGFRFFTTLDKSVIDGTPCRLQPTEALVPVRQPGGSGSSFDLPHVCVSGICTSIGCDGIAGSQRRLDRCGVCGGDNSTCRVISGIFTRPQLPVGYNIVAHIPRGACNLNITQIRKSPNYLALRRRDGTFILNGNWAISWPGEYEGAGAKFQYKRQDAMTMESIESPGPLQEPVDLLVLSQQANPGIKYEYMLPMNDSPIPAVPQDDEAMVGSGGQSPLTYQRPNVNPRTQSAAVNRPSSFVPASIPKHPNEPRASPFGVSSPSNSISSFPRPSPVVAGQNLFPDESAYPGNLQPTSGHPHLHGHNGRRRGHNGQAGNRLNGVNGNGNGNGNSEKKFYWKVTGYTNCTEICGGGTQKSLIRCFRDSNGAPVADRRCNPDEKVFVQTTVRCNLKPCPAEWTVGPWSDCSEPCDEGFQTRTVHCQQKVSPTLTMRVAEGACLVTQPESRKSCLSKPCHRWETTEFSQCSATCGNGIRSRKTKCVNSAGDTVQASNCEASSRPVEISACNMGPCEGLNWFASEWSSECSERCGEGLQTRHVLCAQLKPGGSTNTRRNRRRHSSREMETNSIEDIEDEDERSSSEFRETLCDVSRRPAEERECFADRDCLEPSWYTGPWSQCSVSCGNGLRTRQVLCILLSRGKFKVVAEADCGRFIKPDIRETCENSRPCPPRWFTTEWGECDASCGGGLQRRSVSCRNSNWTRPSSICYDATRPIDRRSCNDNECDGSSRTQPEALIRDRFPVTAPDNDTSILDPSSWDERYKPRNWQQTTTARPPVSHIQPTTSQSLIEPNEEPDSTECTDQYRNCALVVQARLCRYKYYRSVCCTACKRHESEKHT